MKDKVDFYLNSIKVLREIERYQNIDKKDVEYKEKSGGKKKTMGEKNKRDKRPGIERTKKVSKKRSKKKEKREKEVR